MRRSNLPTFESLETRCLMSASAGDQVLGIATPALADTLVFVPNPALVFNAIPTVTGTYAGHYTLQGGIGGVITIDIASQDFATHTVAGAVDVNYFGIDDVVISATGHVNLHGGFYLAGSNTQNGHSFALQIAGHLDVNVTEVTNGGFEFTDPTGTQHFGHFSLMKTSLP